jgi:hypothetical protein
MAFEVGATLVMIGMAAGSANGGVAGVKEGAALDAKVAAVISNATSSTAAIPNAGHSLAAPASNTLEASRYRVTKVDRRGARSSAAQALPRGASDGALSLQAGTAPVPPAPAPVPPAAAAPGALPASPAPAPPAAAPRKPAPPAGATDTAPTGDAAPAAPDAVAPGVAGTPAPAETPTPAPAETPTPAPAPSAAAAPSPAAPEPPVAPGPEVTPAAAAPAPEPVSGAAAVPAPTAGSGAELPVPGVAPAAQAPPAAPPTVETAVPSQPGARGSAVFPRDKAESSRVMPQNALPPGQIDVPGGFSIAVGTQMSFGQSTFQFGSSYAKDPMVDWSLSLSPSYFFSDGTRLSASASLSQELTQSGGDDDPQTIIFSDIGLSASRSLYRFKGGPQIFGSLALQLPTSESSRIETLRTSVGARLSASQPVGPVFISLGTGYRKNFHEYTHPTRNPNTGDPFTTRDGLVVEELVTGIARNGGSELAGATYFEGESNNTSMVWSNSLSAFWPVTEKLGIGISYNLSHSWTYESYELDELSGVGAKEGRGRRDSHGGGIFANYQALDQLAFGLGMATGGPTRTADDKRVRFPFFNLEGPESNMTTFFISATYTEAISL